MLWIICNISYVYNIYVLQIHYMNWLAQIFCGVFIHKGYLSINRFMEHVDDAS